MKRKMPTLLVLLVMALIGAMYWVDLNYYTDPATGFITKGSVLFRYLILVLPLLMVLLGLHTLNPRAIAVLRVRSTGLAALFTVAAAVGIAFGIMRIVYSIPTVSIYGIVLGALFIWYGVWMFLAGLQLFVQHAPSPTVSAIWGVLAALPYCVLTIYRILINPSSLYRMGMVVKAFAALFTILWFGMLLRSFYIALPQKRVRWMYLLGVFTFLFCTCLELPTAIHAMLFLNATPVATLESINMGVLGIVAAAISVAIAGQEDVIEDKSPF